MLVSNNILPEGLVGAFYGRHSTDLQDMDAQKHSARSFVQKSGSVIGYYYEDSNVSAVKKKIEDRPELTRLLKDAPRGKFEFIVVSNHDRLARSPMEHQEIRRKLKSCNVPVYISTTEERYDIGDLLTQIIKDGVSKLEADNTRLRTKNTLESFVKKGEWPGGRVPYGYEYSKIVSEGKKVVEFKLISGKKDIIMKVFELYQKDLGFTAISNELQSLYPSESLSKGRVKSIITNPFYAGYFTINRKKGKSHKSLYDDQANWIMQKSTNIQATISIEEWQNCWRIYQKRKKRNTKEIQEDDDREEKVEFFNTSNYFQNLIYCKHCGQSLKCKNQITKSNTGNEYGEKIYHCTHCRELRIEAGLLHTLVNKICRDIAALSNSEIRTSVQTKLLKEKEELESKVNTNNANVHQVYEQLKRLDSELNTLINMNNKENKSFIRVLLMSKQKLVDELSNYEEKTKVLEKEINSISFVLDNQSLWKHWMEDIFNGDLTNNQLNIRRLMVHHVKRITIDKDGSVDLLTVHFPESFKYEIDLAK
ncbi:recombinase family protein [Fictibacillus sp. KU28468]|uniref:recombinase family protein n=1 Tax=Fictibacillus sp. KU28468 TaxID=2991053 RepID=UPI00223E0037|nr:recombinase family protein [Fictibacillus sp. KU28468]UZJ81069.1 recombinase family protein [Fictibacillus sp. KU28468]